MVEGTPEHTIDEHALLILALESLEGVGRVSTRKILRHFATLDEIARTPREQVLNRLKGVPSAAKMVDRLLDKEVVATAVADVGTKMAGWSEKGVSQLTFLDQLWPERLNEMPNPHRPNLLFTYGQIDLLAEPCVAIVAKDVLNEGSFERAQKLINVLCEQRVRLSIGLATGFDVVAIKLSEAAQVAPIAVAPSGLARVEKRMRPHATRVVKSGGLLVSPLPMDHGPFEHDRKESFLVQAAMARAVVFVDPERGSFEWLALEWALEHGLPVFGISHAELPGRVHPIERPIDMEWVAVAVDHVGR